METFVMVRALRDLLQSTDCDYWGFRWWFSRQRTKELGLLNPALSIAEDLSRADGCGQVLQISRPKPPKADSSAIVRRGPWLSLFSLELFPDLHNSLLLVRCFEDFRKMYRFTQAFP